MIITYMLIGLMIGAVPGFGLAFMYAGYLHRTTRKLREVRLTVNELKEALGCGGPIAPAVSTSLGLLNLSEHLDSIELGLRDLRQHARN